MISAVNALTLSPALAALFLKNKHTEDGMIASKKSFSEKFYAGFNSSFNTLPTGMLAGLKFLIRNKWISMGGLALIIVVTVYLVSTTKSGFIPTEDQGFVAIAVSTPSGTSLDDTTKILKQAEDAVEELCHAARFVTAIVRL